MPYTHKAVWQYVLHRALRKTFIMQRNCFGTAAITIIFIPEAHLLCIYGRNAVVAYGYFMGVPSLSILSRVMVRQRGVWHTLPMAFCHLPLDTVKILVRLEILRRFFLQSMFIFK